MLAYIFNVVNCTMPRVSTGILAFRVAIAAQEGGDVATILRAADVPPGVMESNPPYVDLETERRVWIAMVEVTGRDDIGLVCGLRFPTQAMGVLGYAMANAPTLRVAVEKCCDYQRIMGDSMGMVCERGPTKTKIWIEQWTEWHEPLRHTVDCFMAAIMSWSSANTPAPAKPRSVAFHYERPADPAPHERVFAPAPVSFGAATSHQIYDNEVLDQPVIGANRETFYAFEEKVRRLAVRVDAAATWSDRVRQRILATLKGSTPTLDSVASELAVSPRSLQQRLAEESTSFSEILNEARTDLAKEFLKEGDIRNEEIAYLLGYSEESVFSRSFKKWTGRTPTQYRAAGGA